MFKLAIVFALFGIIHCHSRYQKLIPNGDSVPDPCSTTGGIWAPVGHYNPGHPTKLINEFGKSFRGTGYTWTRELCMADSDQDGQTNGEELGDPLCIWKVGDTPQHRASGHPGICEPVGQGHCHYQHFSCDCYENCHGLH